MREVHFVEENDSQDSSSRSPSSFSVTPSSETTPTSLELVSHKNKFRRGRRGHSTKRVAFLAAQHDTFRGVLPGSSSTSSSYPHSSKEPFATSPLSLI